MYIYIPQLLRVRCYDLMIYPIPFFRTHNKVMTGHGMYTKIYNSPSTNTGTRNTSRNVNDKTTLVFTHIPQPPAK